MSFLVGRLTGFRVVGVQTLNISNYVSVPLQSQKSNLSAATKAGASFQEECNGQETSQERQIGENVSRKDKVNFLVNTLLDIKDNKEAVYGALDAWVAWEQSFPIASLKRVLLALEKEQQWHRVIQVIKWMLSKGQGTTLGTYGQLIQALDKDQRAEEAQKFWEQRIGIDLHSVPWQLCNRMISIYYRNNMLKNLVKLFKDLEAFDRKPPEKSIVQKVANAYEILGQLEEKERVLEKYKNLFTEDASPRRRGKAPPKKKRNKGILQFNLGQ